jgi:transcriptional regulator with XRE-family HTH domain
MTMKQLGAEIGVAESTVSQYETGKREPDNETLLRIGELFNVTVGYLLGAEEEKENPTSQKTGEVDERINDMWGQLTPQEREYFFSQIKDYLKMRGQ